jgi:hypothetical protein
MPMTREEHLAYQRGYNRALRSVADRVSRVIRIARGYRDRHFTQGRCATCDRWTRGCRGCLWGTCRADFEPGIEPRMWTERFAGENSGRSIETSEDFACVNWLPRIGAARKEIGDA